MLEEGFGDKVAEEMELESTLGWWRGVEIDLNLRQALALAPPVFSRQGERKRVERVALVSIGVTRKEVA